MERGQKLYKIGELAALTGVPAKTIRFYSDEGVLPPAQVLPSGYRLYSDDDRLRLVLVRTLREVGLDLPTIVSLLDARRSISDVLTMQLEAVEMNLRTMQRQRLLLRAALNQGETGALAYLDRTRAVALLDRREREAFLGRHLARVFEGVPADDAWKARFWEAAVLDLPEEMSPAQLEAWLELAALVSDEDFLQGLNRMSHDFWSSLPPGTDPQRFQEALDTIYAEAIEARAAGHTPDSLAGQALADRFVKLQADLLGEAPTRDFAARMVQNIEARQDPRAERYWELVAIIKGWPISPIGAAHRWLMEGLRWLAALPSRADTPPFDTTPILDYHN